jgi:molecular chaperone GrpE
MTEENRNEEKNNGAAATAQDLGPEERDAFRKLAAERDQFRDLAQRTRAEFENYQKRNQKDREQERRYWYTPLALDLLPIVDNLDRTLAAAKQAGATGPLVQGVAMVQGQFLETLKRHGITRIEADGKPFDPNVHQAVVQQPSPDHEPGTVLQVLEQGFMNHDRVLRPAKVVVSSK